MNAKRILFGVAVGVLTALLAMPAWAVFAAKEVYLPSVGRGPGLASSSWYTTTWVYNPNATPVNVTIYFLERASSNPAPPSYADTLAAGETKRYANTIGTLFSVEKFGALRIVANNDIVVNGRIYTVPVGGAEKDTTGQFFGAIPASFAIASGQKTQVLGVYQTNPADASQYRYNYGFVETAGGSVSFRVTVTSAAGSPVDSKDYSLGAYGVAQYSMTSQFPAISTENARIQVEVLSGSGKLAAFGSGLANSSNDPSTFEMSYRGDLLASASSGGLSTVAHDATLTGDGTSGAPLSIANAAISKAKLSATGGSAGQVLGTNGTSLLWQSISAGLSLPYEGSTASAAAAFKATNTGAGWAGVFSVENATSTYPALVGSHSGDGVAVYGNGLTNSIGVKGVSLNDVAVWAESTNGEGLYAYGKANGVHGKNDSPIKSGVWGENTGGGYGVAGSTSGATTAGVWGSNSGNGYGTLGTSAGGFGVVGRLGSGSGFSGVPDSGVWGDSQTGTGVYGTSAQKPGVYGVTMATSGSLAYAVGGHATLNNNLGYLGGINNAVYGGAANGYGVYASTADADAYGVYGRQGSATGLADANHKGGVWGDSIDGQGVLGTSRNTVGVGGMSNNKYGVQGLALGGGSNGVGVIGFSQGTAAYAGYFSGAVRVTGTLTKPAGSFMIDHPLDPSNKYLYHSFVESPDMMNIYNGNVQTDAQGTAVVTMPAYFSALNRDFRYQLTVIGEFAQAIVGQEIDNDRFVIKTDKPFVKVSWQVTGIRKDPWANAHRIPVEEEKPDAERGFYLHPELYEQPAEKGLDWARDPGLMEKVRQLLNNAAPVQEQ